jgi:hypothetical protein
MKDDEMLKGGSILAGLLRSCEVFSIILMGEGDVFKSEDGNGFS